MSDSSGLNTPNSRDEPTGTQKPTLLSSIPPYNLKQTHSSHNPSLLSPFPTQNSNSHRSQTVHVYPTIENNSQNRVQELTAEVERLRVEVELWKEKYKELETENQELKLTALRYKAQFLDLNQEVGKLARKFGSFTIDDRILNKIPSLPDYRHTQESSFSRKMEDDTSDGGFKDSGSGSNNGERDSTTRQSYDRTVDENYRMSMLIENSEQDASNPDASKQTSTTQKTGVVTVTVEEDDSSAHPLGGHPLGGSTTRSGVKKKPTPHLYEFSLNSSVSSRPMSTSISKSTTFDLTEQKDLSPLKGDSQNQGGNTSPDTIVKQDTSKLYNFWREANGMISFI